MGQPLGKVPLERALSKLGIASRSQTRALIAEGRIKVEGKVIKDPQFLLTPETAKITIDDKSISKATTVLIMLNKPKGYVTTKSDEKGRKTVYYLLPKELQSLHAVGRLDMNTTGLLLLTNDTKFSSYLTDPENAFERVYVTTVEGRFDEEKAKLLKSGIKDGEEILRAKNIELRKISNRESHLTVTLTEGKNREIRRMFKALGHKVTALKRIKFAHWLLEDLPLGQYKELKMPKDSKGTNGEGTPVR